MVVMVVSKSGGGTTTTLSDGNDSTRARKSRILLLLHLEPQVVAEQLHLKQDIEMVMFRFGTKGGNNMGIFNEFNKKDPLFFTGIAAPERRFRTFGLFAGGGAADTSIFLI